MSELSKGMDSLAALSVSNAVADEDAQSSIAEVVWLLSRATNMSELTSLVGVIKTEHISGLAFLAALPGDNQKIALKSIQNVASLSLIAQQANASHSPVEKKKAVVDERPVVPMTLIDLPLGSFSSHMAYYDEYPITRHDLAGDVSQGKINEFLEAQVYPSEFVQFNIEKDKYFRHFYSRHNGVISKEDLGVIRGNPVAAAACAIRLNYQPSHDSYLKDMRVEFNGVERSEVESLINSSSDSVMFASYTISIGLIKRLKESTDNKILIAIMNVFSARQEPVVEILACTPAFWRTGLFDKAPLTLDEVKTLAILTENSVAIDCYRDLEPRLSELKSSLGKKMEKCGLRDAYNEICNPTLYQQQIANTVQDTKTRKPRKSSASKDSFDL